MFTRRQRIVLGLLWLSCFLASSIWPWFWWSGCFGLCG